MRYSIRPPPIVRHATGWELPKLPDSIGLTTLWEKPIKIGAKVVSRSKSLTFQMAEVAVPRTLFAAILERIGRLRASPQSV